MLLDFRIARGRYCFPTPIHPLILSLLEALQFFLPFLSLLFSRKDHFKATKILNFSSRRFLGQQYEVLSIAQVGFVFRFNVLEGREYRQRNPLLPLGSQFTATLYTLPSFCCLFILSLAKKTNQAYHRAWAGVTMRSLSACQPRTLESLPITRLWAASSTGITAIFGVLSQCLFPERYLLGLKPYTWPYIKLLLMALLWTGWLHSTQVLLVLCGFCPQVQTFSSANIQVKRTERILNLWPPLLLLPGLPGQNLTTLSWRSSSMQCLRHPFCIDSKGWHWHSSEKGWEAECLAAIPPIYSSRVFHMSGLIVNKMGDVGI